MTSYTDEYGSTLIRTVPAGITLAPGAPAPLGSPLPAAIWSGPVAEAETYAADANLIWHMIPGNAFNLGFNYQSTLPPSFVQYYNYDPLTYVYQGNVQTYNGDRNWMKEGVGRTTYGAYVQDQQDFESGLSLIAGLRFDTYSDIGSELSPRAGMIYKASDTSRIKLFYGHAYRAPSLTELYVKNNPVVQGNSDLKSERIDTIELSYSHDIKNRMTATLTGFYNYTQNLITAGPPIPPTVVVPFINSGTLMTNGLEFEMKVIPINALSIMGTYTRILGNTQTLEQPRNSASAIINYSLGQANLNLSSTYRSASEIYPTDMSHILFSTRVGYNIVKNFQVTGTIENIGDEVFTQYSPNLSNIGVPIRGRTFYVGLRYED